MKDLGPTASLPSPCINVCRMAPDNGLCEGCLRTLDEIAQWSTASDRCKEEIWQQLRQRAEQLKPAPTTDAGNPGAQDQR